MIKINKPEAQKANLSGKGGKEFLLKNVFTIPNTDCKRISAPLYDFVQGENKLEIKKQGDTQWFDIGKYHNLKKEDQNIDIPKPKKITVDVPNNHLKYAITWYSIAISILLYYLYFRKKK